MSTYNINLTLENIRTITVMFLDIFIMWLLLYYVIRLVRSSSRTVQIFKGVLLVFILDRIAKFLGLKTLSYVTDIFINWGFLALIIVFQPEIRSILEKLGKSNVFSRITTLTGNEKENLVDQIVTATMLLSRDSTGALISIEQSHSLDDFVATGTKLNSDVTAELLTSIFVTSTPLHDGAVIIQGDKIACASAYFPPTNLDLPSKYGARHRAAIGISEITDAVTIIVSEETGAVSVTEGGKIQTVNRRQLRDYLLRVICGEETEVRASGAPETVGRDVIIDDSAAEKKSEEKASQTGVLSKLAIKKQEDKTGKIEVEEVVTSNVQPENSGDEYITHLEEEANEIKLPHKKDRPVPSYPENNSTKRFEEQRRLEEQLRKEEEKKQEEERLAARRAKAEADYLAAEEARRKAAEEMNRTSRMSAEDVKAAREKAMRKLQGLPEEEEKPAEEPASEEKESKEDESPYDTRKLDISKLMGMDNDLDKTLEMIDSLTDESDGEGGED